jgi:hypothetical protein
MSSLPESDHDVCDHAAQAALAELFARCRQAGQLGSRSEAVRVAEAAHKAAQARLEAERAKTADEPDTLPWGPTEADWSEYAEWSREMEARREIEDESDREAFEAACGNREPADDDD